MYIIIHIKKSLSTLILVIWILNLVIYSPIHKNGYALQCMVALLSLSLYIYIFQIGVYYNSYQEESLNIDPCFSLPDHMHGWIIFFFFLTFTEAAK